MYSIVDTKKDRVKNWKRGEGSKQVSRWAAVTLKEAQRRVRKVPEHGEIPALEAELRKWMVESQNGGSAVPRRGTALVRADMADGKSGRNFLWLGCRVGLGGEV